MAQGVATEGTELFREEIAEVESSMGNMSPGLRSSMGNDTTGIFCPASSPFRGEEEGVNANDVDKRMGASVLKDYEYDKDDGKVIELPTVQVRYQNLNVDAQCHIGGRALPTLRNVARNIFEGILEALHISTAKKTEFSILKDVNGIIQPSRVTLLLGPPGCGKTTLLLALAGQLDPILKRRGHVSYNGFQLNEFVAQKTSAYISQHDLHIAEMKVRETFDFAVRCQGVGTRHDLLLEIRKREREAGILPETDIDMYMKGMQY